MDKEMKAIMNDPTDIDRRFFTTEDIQVFDSPELFRERYTIPKNTLVKYRRIVVRNETEMALIIEPDGDYSYFLFDKCKECIQCVVKEEGLDILNFNPQNLKEIKVRFQQKEYKDLSQRLTKSEIIKDEANTHLLLRDKIKDKHTIVHVTINDLTQNYEMKLLRPNTKFYWIKNYFTNKGNVIAFPDGQLALMYNNEGLFDVIEEPVDRLFFVLLIALAILFFVIGIIYIAIETGYIVVVGIIMVPAAIIASAIIVLPIKWAIKSILKRL
jgi:hypothetical protein